MELTLTNWHALTLPSLWALLALRARFLPLVSVNSWDTRDFLKAYKFMGFLLQ